ncbi:MAG: hypothetical protein JWM63_141 [Gammaproteobacteria bacterium]|jgi:hypothetical protein|nr:hypothetical protein [Gammaproteobacteria bacterium]
MRSANMENRGLVYRTAPPIRCFKADCPPAVNCVTLLTVARGAMVSEGWCNPHHEQSFLGYRVELR